MPLLQFPTLPETFRELNDLNSIAEGMKLRGVSIKPDRFPALGPERNEGHVPSMFTRLVVVEQGKRI